MHARDDIERQGSHMLEHSSDSTRKLLGIKRETLASILGESVRLYATEFVGTFLLVFTITMKHAYVNDSTLATRPNASHSDWSWSAQTEEDASCPGSSSSGAESQALTVGMAMALVATVGARISGAHYNPATTVALYVAGSRNAPRPALYAFLAVLAAVSAQFLAEFVGSGGSTSASSGGGALNTLPVFQGTLVWVRVCAAELIGAYLFSIFVLYTTMVNKELGQVGPVLVGVSFYVCIMTFKDVSGAVLNPALTLSLFVVGWAKGATVQWFGPLMYMLAQFIGAGGAAVTTRRLTDSTDALLFSQNLLTTEGKMMDMQPKKTKFGYNSTPTRRNLQEEIRKNAAQDDHRSMTISAL